MTATPRPYSSYSSLEIVHILGGSNCSVQIEDEIKRRLDIFDEANTVLLDAKACLAHLRDVQQWGKETGDHIDEAEDLLSKVCAILTKINGVK